MGLKPFFVEGKARLQKDLTRILFSLRSPPLFRLYVTCEGGPNATSHSTLMKNEIHPETFETTITCTCGKVYNTLSTVKNLKIGICAACHPFFTGEQRFVDTAGRVDKFAQRYGSTTAERRGKPKAAKASA